MSGGVPKKPSLFVDTSVIMYASGTEHPLKEPSVAVLEAAASGTAEMKTSVEVVQEILHRFIHLGRRQQGIMLARQVVELFQPLLPVRPRDIRLAIDLLERYPALSSRDALHAAVALNNGISRIVSADRDFELVREVEQVAPGAIVT